MNRTVRRSARYYAQSSARRFPKRFAQWSLVIALTVLLGGSPASAGWLRHKLKQHCCQPAISCCVVAQPVCPPPAPVCNPEPACCPAPPVSCAPPAPSVPCCDYSSVPSCCDDSSVSAAPMEMSPSYDMGMPVETGTPIEMPMEGTVVDDAMMAAPMTESLDQNYDQGTVIESASPAPIEETVQQPEQPFESAPAVAPPVPSEPEPAAVEPTEPEPAVVEPEMAEPEMAAEPEPDPTTDSDNDDLFGGPADEMSTDPMPADEPGDDMSADDLFGGSDDTAPVQPMDSVEDDLFGGSSNDAPVEAETSMDDLFGDPPADSPVEDPSESMDDLFGDPPSDSGDAMPNSDEQPSIDDLFGDTSSQEDSSTESMVSEETSIDDLFGTSEPSEVASDEIFDAPAQEEADSDFNIDDLFGQSAAPAENVVADASVDSNVAEELSVSSDEAVAQEAAVQVVSKSVMPTNALDETRIRTWIDNTGIYHVDGRLIEIGDDHVRLLKANGRTCTVPNSRLCEADAAYVDAIREQADSSRLAMLTSK